MRNCKDCGIEIHEMANHTGAEFWCEDCFDIGLKRDMNDHFAHTVKKELEEMNMKDVMIDFETFGNGKNACVVQVGACFFNRVTGEIGDTFKRNIDARDAVKRGAELDADTIYWWLAQSPEAIKSILELPQYPIEDVFTDLNFFLEKAQYIWSHATFDFVILQETLKRLNIKPKYSYRAARDIRTLLDLSFTDYKAFTREGVHHDGLADAIHQVKYCVHALNKIKRHENADTEASP